MSSVSETNSSKDEQIRILQQRIEDFKEQLKNPESFTYSLYNSNAPKKDHIRAWAEALEDLHTLGVYTDDITTISTYIRHELKNMGLEHAIHWAKRTLPYKYKDHSKDHAEKLFANELQEIRGRHTPDTVKSKEQIQDENQRYIDELDQDIEVLETFRKKLLTNEFVSKLDPFQLDEYFTAKKQSRKLLYNGMDGRDKVLTEKMHIMLHAYTEGTKSFSFTKYMEHVREILKLSSKQAIKILTGRVSKVEILYDPKNRFDARHVGFYGIQCGECGSWRVDIRYDSDATKDRLFCYACKTWNELKTERLVSKLV